MLTKRAGNLTDTHRASSQHLVPGALPGAGGAPRERRDGGGGRRSREKATQREGSQRGPGASGTCAPRGPLGDLSCQTLPTVQAQGRRQGQQPGAALRQGRQWPSAGDSKERRAGTEQRAWGGGSGQASPPAPGCCNRLCPALSAGSRERLEHTETAEDWKPEPAAADGDSASQERGLETRWRLREGAAQSTSRRTTGRPGERAARGHAGGPRAPSLRAGQAAASPGLLRHRGGHGWRLRLCLKLCSGQEMFFAVSCPGGRRQSPPVCAPTATSGLSPRLTGTGLLQGGHTGPGHPW